MSGLPVSALAFAAALGGGLTAGFFFSFSFVVMGALARLPAPQGIAAMQSINVVVLNPWFFTAFFGTALVCLALAGLSLFQLGDPRALLLLAGAALYLAGVIVVTMAFNVPLNDALAAVAPGAPDAETVWTRYLSVWTAWNHVRTIAPLLASAAFIAALQR